MHCARLRTADKPLPAVQPESAYPNQVSAREYVGECFTQIHPVAVIVIESSESDNADRHSVPDLWF